MPATIQKKPSVMDLLQLFIIASCLFTVGTYLYTWAHNLAPEQEQIVNLISAGGTVPFGVAVTAIWWEYHESITAAIGRLSVGLVGIQKKVQAMLIDLYSRFK